MKQTIIIDESKCDGCGICVTACDEGALDMIDGKAKLVREDFCDGLGHCIPACPRGAITFVDAEPRSQNAIPMVQDAGTQCSCSGTLTEVEPVNKADTELRQWPVKLKLLPETSPYFNNADLLLVADCSAFAYAKMHERFIKGRTIVICCPKFDSDIVERLANLISRNDLKSITLVRMSVPCCSLDKTFEKALEISGKSIPFKTFIVDKSGTVKEA